MKKFWKWQNQADADPSTVRVLELNGTIAEESWFDDDVTPAMFKAELFSGNGPVTIWINSPGGDCIAASQKSLAYNPAADEMVIIVHRWFANKSCPGDWLYSRLGDLASKVTAALGGTTEAPAKPVEPEQPKAQIYRVRKTWADAKSQVGAYKVLANAKISADAHPSYSVFDADGNVVYPVEQKVETPAVPFRVWIKVTDLNIRKGPGTNYDATGRFTGKGVFTIVAVQPGEGSTAGWGRLKSGAGWISLDYTTTI